MWFSPSVIATSRANTFLVRGRRPHPPLRGTFPNGEERVTTAHSWLHLMVRTGDFAKQSSGSAALETEGFARAGRGLQAARDC